MNLPVQTEDLPDDSQYSPLLQSYWKNMRHETEKCNSKIERLDRDYAELVQERISAIGMNVDLGVASYKRDCFMFNDNPMAVNMFYQMHFRVYNACMARIQHEDASLASSYWQVRMGYWNEAQRKKNALEHVFKFEVDQARQKRKKDKKARKVGAAVNKRTRKLDYENRVCVNQFSRELRQDIWISTRATNQARPVNFADPDPEILFGPN